MYKYDEVKRQIIDDVSMMKPHQKIMSRPAMCRKYQVTRTTVERAVSELVKSGILYSNVGSGTFVSEEMSDKLSSGVVDVSNWGVVIPHIQYDLYPDLLNGICSVAEANGINVMVCETDNDINRQHTQIKRYIDSGVRGLIIVPSTNDTSDIRAFQALYNRKIPFIFCNRSVPTMAGVPLVASNDFYGGYIATKLLIERHYRRIAYLSLIAYKSSLDRYYGYMAALMEHGIEVDRGIIKMNLGNSQNGAVKQCALKMLNMEDPPDAFFCFNDRLLKEVYMAADELGLAISDEVGVIGYDNTNLCQTLSVKATSISFKPAEIGTTAANLLLRLIAGEKIDNPYVCVFQPEIIERDSCKGKVDA
ncbi:MAG: GntR family transcriptional regulator [Clostridiales bacterium]|jgi:DNA-binding LacI/PurR family transcriptional regulator|nr:GntR family transcriptional regulator [Clostridiales bacterium]